MNLLDGLLRADQGLLRLNQRVYDHVWDRWGIHVGTYRFLIALVGLSDNLLFTSVDAVTGKTSFGMAALNLCFGFAVLWLFWGIIHLGVEWRLQAEGKYEALNNAALRHQGRNGHVFRAILFGIVLLLCASYSIETEPYRAILKPLTGLIFMGWGYSLAVLVRDREPDRFLAPAPNAA